MYPIRQQFNVNADNLHQSRHKNQFGASIIQKKAGKIILQKSLEESDSTDEKFWEDSQLNFTVNVKEESARDPTTVNNVFLQLLPANFLRIYSKKIYDSLKQYEVSCQKCIPSIQTNFWSSNFVPQSSFCNKDHCFNNILENSELFSQEHKKQFISLLNSFPNSKECIIDILLAAAPTIQEEIALCFYLIVRIIKYKFSQTQIARKQSLGCEQLEQVVAYLFQHPKILSIIFMSDENCIRQEFKALIEKWITILIEIEKQVIMTNNQWEQTYGIGVEETEYWNSEKQFKNSFMNDQFYEQKWSSSMTQFDQFGFM